VTQYLVTLAAAAKKELKDLPSDAIGRVFPRIRELAGNPRPVGCKKLHGYKDRWRIRVGS
jgi:mRNA interferase RelE/StbE